MWAHVASQLVVQLDTIVSRRVDPAESAVLSVTRLAGGSSHNVLPAGATLTGTVRSFDRYHPATVNSSAQAQLALQSAAAAGLQAAVARRTRAGFRFPSTDLTMTITVLRQTATVPGLQPSSW